MEYTIGHAFNAMTSDMRNKLSSYQTSLEHRYGDPRTYALEREQMAADTASVLYSDGKSREQLLESVYDKKRGDARSTHVSRMARSAQDKRPQYLTTDQPGQTRKPRAPRRRSA